MGRKVRKTLNIDAAKLKQAREYLKLETETEVIDRLLDDLVWERKLPGGPPFSTEELQDVSVAADDPPTAPLEPAAP